jgi:hypothetical protein
MSRRTITGTLSLLTITVGTAIWGADAQVPPLPVSPPPAAPTATNGIGPKIQFEATIHDFGKVKSGDIVKYTYVFTNGGDQVLELSGVQACGCITADYTKKVEPGKTGSIPLSFNSGGYGGDVNKSIIVTCNDRSNSRPVLQFKGNIWRPIDILPQFAVLNLNADAPLGLATILITNNVLDPLTLSSPECNNAAFAAELVTTQPGKEFRLVIRPAKPLPPGNAQTQVTLKTSSTNMPVISINVFATMQPAITANPAQVVLPPAPLAQPFSNIVNLVNNSTNHLTLSEPTVSASGVEVQLKEGSPGRNFTATLVFPQGFEIAAGQHAELIMKSSLTAMPTLKVPILQAARPAAPVPPPPPRASAGPKEVPVVKKSLSPRPTKPRAVVPADLPPVPP